MNILHVIPFMATRAGGSPFSTAALAHAVLLNGGSASVFCTDIGTSPQGNEVQRLRDTRELVPVASGVDLRIFPTASPMRLAYSPALRAALRAELADFDLVHIHTLFLYPQYAAFVEAGRQSTPFVISPHGAFDPVLRRNGRFRKRTTRFVWQDRMFNNASCIHVTSQQEANWCRESGYHQTLRIIPNAVQMESYAGIRQLRTRQVPNTKLSVFSHGRLSMKKGLPVLLSAIARIRQEVPDVRLTLIGPDDEGVGNQLRVQALELGITDNIEYAGPLAPSDIARRLELATVWALPSHGENFGIAVVEAMAAGVPVVTTPEVNIAPLAAAEDALLMVERSPEQFASAILDLYRNPTRATRLAENGMRYASRYTPELLAASYGALYREFCS